MAAFDNFSVQSNQMMQQQPTMQSTNVNLDSQNRSMQIGGTVFNEYGQPQQQQSQQYSNNALGPIPYSQPDQQQNRQMQMYSNQNVNRPDAVQQQQIQQSKQYQPNQQTFQDNNMNMDQLRPNAPMSGQQKAKQQQQQKPPNTGQGTNSQFSMPRSMPLYNMANQLTSSPSNSYSSNQSTPMSYSGQSELSMSNSNPAMPAVSMARNIVNASQGRNVNQPTHGQPHSSHLSIQPQGKTSLSQLTEWVHGSELSPIMDVSPSVEAAEAQELINNKRRSMVSVLKIGCNDNQFACSQDMRQLNPNAQIPQAPTGTISGMLDDFNRAIENLSITNNVDDLEAKIKQNKLTMGPFNKSTTSLPGTSSPKNANTRRASTGQVDNLDSYKQLQQQKQQQLLQNKAAESLSLINQANHDIETLRQQKALLQSNSQIEQKLQKQQQMLIQQQQQFLQIQLEQQKLQTQMQEQLSSQALAEQQQKQQQQLQQNGVNMDNRKQGESVSRNSSNTSRHHHSLSSERRKTMETVAVNTEISQQDMVQADHRLRHKSSATNVMKQDKQVSTSITPPPSSLTSTPTGPIQRPMSQMGGPNSTATSSRMSGMVESDQAMRSRVTSASSSSASMARRLPQPMSGDEPHSYGAGSTSYHQQRPQSSVTAISQRSNSPLVARKTMAKGSGIVLPSPSNKIMGTGPTSQLISSILAKKALPISNSQTGPAPVGGSPAANAARAYLNTTNTFNSLGYLDLDTKNVTFEGDKGKRRKLPTAPKDEEPVSSMLATRKLIKERLSSGMCSLF